MSRFYLLVFSSILQVAGFYLLTNDQDLLAITTLMISLVPIPLSIFNQKSTKEVIKTLILTIIPFPAIYLMLFLSIMFLGSITKGLLYLSTEKLQITLMAIFPILLGMLAISIPLIVGSIAIKFAIQKLTK